MKSRPCCLPLASCRAARWARGILRLTPEGVGRQQQLDKRLVVEDWTQWGKGSPPTGGARPNQADAQVFFLRHESKYRRLNRGPAAGQTWDQVKQWLVDEGLIEESLPF